VDRHTDRNQR